MSVDKQWLESSRMTYSDMLRDPRWQKKRLRIFERDDFQCQDCGYKDKPLQVHHIRYTPKSPPWDTDDDFLITVCDKCHKERQKMEALVNSEIARLMRHMSPSDMKIFMDSIACFKSQHLCTDSFPMEDGTDRATTFLSDNPVLLGLNGPNYELVKLPDGTIKTIQHPSRFDYMHVIGSLCGTRMQDQYLQEYSPDKCIQNEF